MYRKCINRPNNTRLNYQGFLEAGLEISTSVKAGEMHAYFKQAAPRLFRALQLFNLNKNDSYAEVLDIGPFFSYIPFILRGGVSSYTIFEARDPAINCLLPLYKSRDINVKFVDMFDLFGPSHSHTQQLDLPSDSMNLILCWEVMEHFPFNPVKFCRELYRLLKPGGRVCVTVPNKASFQAIYSLITGRNQADSISTYFQFEDYICAGKKVFYGFHWREYSPFELRTLFQRVGFDVTACEGFTVFHDNHKPSFGRRIARSMAEIGTQIAPQYGSNIYLEAVKPLNSKS